MKLGMVFQLAVGRYPEATAILTERGQISYRKWGERVGAMIVGLSCAGIRPGDRIGICAESGEMTATAFLAVHCMSATAVMINARWKSGDIAYALQDAQVKGALFDEQVCLKIKQIMDGDIVFACGGREGKERLSFVRFKEQAESSWPPVEEDGIGTILYTSGTTGRPKGICRSPRSDYFAALAIALEHRWERFECILSVMPLYHTMGLHTLLAQVILNATAVIPNGTKPADYGGFLESGKVSALYLVPTMYHDLIKHAAGYELPPVKKLAFAGAPMDAQLQEASQKLLSPEIFVNQYGCNEMAAITANSRLDQKPLSAGRPALLSRIRLVGLNEEGEEVIVGTGEKGEILVDATLPQTFLEYINNQKETERKLRDGWYYTGDIGYLDEEGDLFLTGRVDDMIISDGYSPQIK